MNRKSGEEGNKLDMDGYYIATNPGVIYEEGIDSVMCPRIPKQLSLVGRGA